MLITCPECKKEYSSQAKKCVHCGAKNPHRSGAAGKLLGAAAVLAVGLLVLFVVIGTLSPASSSRSASSAEICSQSGEAAHYIAAMSTSPSDVQRVTDQVIADRKYPLLGDKVVASIGGVVILSYGSQTPDEISANIRNTCEHPTGKSE